jgi:carbonic anhydrase/acetyltransferase-like protein (isoleucine patch superfamily)
MLHENVITDFCSKESTPEVDATACVHPLAIVIGRVLIGKNVMVSPFASVRGDEGAPLFLGDDSNVQDGVIIHALETEHKGHPIKKNQVTVQGKDYAVYVGKRVSLAHQTQIHGPALVGDDTFVGMKALVFKAKIGKNCVIEPGCIVMGVSVADGRYIPAGTVLKDQGVANDLPVITDNYPFKDLNKGVVNVNTSLSKEYNKKDLA